jgi:hypothetical protein
MGLLERAKSLKEPSGAPAKEESVAENDIPSEGTAEGFIDHIESENFDSAEMISLDADDSIFTEKNYAAPVKSDDIIMEDSFESEDTQEKDLSGEIDSLSPEILSFDEEEIPGVHPGENALPPITSDEFVPDALTESADGSSIDELVSPDVSGEEFPLPADVSSLDGELEDFLATDTPTSAEEVLSSIPEEPVIEGLPSESEFTENTLTAEESSAVNDLGESDTSDPFKDPEVDIEEKDLLSDIDSVPTGNNERPEPLIIPTAPPVSDDFFGVLLEASRELLRSNTSEDFFNVLLLLVMGQFTASSSAIIVPVDIEEPQGKWTLRDVRGVRLKSRSVTFRGMDPLMGQILESRNILDIEEFAGLDGFREECSLFYSIGARFILPIRAKGVTRVIVTLGDKISGEYDEHEIENMRVYASTVSPVFERLMDIERITGENRQYVERNTEYSDIDRIERDLRRSSGGADIESMIEEKMVHYGAESFCFFVRNERGDSLVPGFCEKADLMGLRASGFSIPADSELCSYFIQKDEWADFENPASFNPLRSVFTDTHIIKMNICAAYPFLIRGYLAGLLMVMRGKREQISDSKPHIMRLSRHVFSFLQGNAAISVYESPFSDIVGKPMLRMEKTLSMADDIGITASFILFHVKNLKRYRSIFGTSDADKLMLRIREIIESRISHSDYGIRTESGKIIVVLPGKTRKYAVPFATAVRNESMAAFRDRENQIMLTYLIAEYPSDGKTLHDILDYLS